MSATISVVIPTFNRKETLKPTLLSLGEQTIRDFEVVVADDGSDDDTGEMVLRLKVPYSLKHVRQKNSGRSAARNMGIQNSSGDVILFIDDHIIADKRLVEEHARSHSEINAAVVRGRVEFCDTLKDVPEKTEYISGKSRTSRLDPFRHFITNNISVRREALLKAGGFDEDFREYGLQDSELGWRLREAGCRFTVNPNAVGYIFGVGLTQENRASRRRQVGRSSVLFCKKHPALGVKLTLSVYWLTRLLFRVYSMFNPKETNLFYSFLKGIEEGLGKYRDSKFRRLNSRLKKKKVLLVSHNSRLEGAPMSLYLLAARLNKGKYDVIFAMPGGGPLKDLAEKWGLDTRILKWPLCRRVRQIASKEQVDLVHVNTLAATWAIRGSRGTGARVIWHLREDPEYLKSVSAEKYLKDVDKIIAISEWVRSAFRLGKTPVAVVHNGVDEKTFSPAVAGEMSRKEFGIGRGELVIGNIGAMSERKGTDVFLRAAKQVLKKKNNARFLMIGECTPGENYEGKLNNLLKELDLGNKMILAGQRSGIEGYMAGMDVVVLSSRSEPFGRTLIEGMAMGKPVIGTDVGGIPEIIDSGRTGLTVPPGDPAALAGAIIRLIDDESLRKDMGRSGRKKVLEKFTIERHTAEIERIYDEVIGNSSGL